MDLGMTSRALIAARATPNRSEERAEVSSPGGVLDHLRLELVIALRAKPDGQ